VPERLRQTWRHAEPRRTRSISAKLPAPSAIFENAVDSLRIGMEFFLKETSYSSRKHAILTVFHAIELLVKDRLAQTDPILIYACSSSSIRPRSGRPSPGWSASG